MKISFIPCLQFTDPLNGGMVPFYNPWTKDRTLVALKSSTHQLIIGWNIGKTPAGTVNGNETFTRFYIRTWAALHGCDDAPTSVRTAFDGGERNLACVEWLGCASPGAEHRVMKCLYDGGHGSWPPQGEALAWWFFNQSRAEYS